jgi:peroxiredoxin
MRIREGQPAPPFAVRDVFDQPVELAAFRGQRLLLSFYRYAGCPLCNLRLGQLVRRWPSWREHGLRLVGVYQSSRDTLREHVARGDVPFPLVADPGQALYRLYGLERSWWGVVRGVFSARFLRGLLSGGVPSGRREGDAARLPADFLIGPDARVEAAYYGRDIGDHLPLPRIDAWLETGREEAGRKP